MKNFNMLLLGDLCLAGEVENRVLKNTEYDIWQQIRKLIQEDDIVVANIECAITDRGNPLALKYATLRAKASCIRALYRLNVAVLGNNHIFDYGEIGVQDTIRHLEAAGIATVGYGQNLNAALRSRIITKNGVKVGLLSFSCPTTNGQNYATPVSPGVAPLSTQLLRRAIEKVHSMVEIIIVYVHWGVEDQHYPVGDQIRLGHRAIDWGADVVIGSHAHVIQPYESYKNGWIFYGLGNFLFADVEWSHTHSDGSIDFGIRQQKPVNKQSIGVKLLVTPTTSGAKVEMADVIAFDFSDELVPRWIHINALIADLKTINHKLAEVTHKYPYLWQGDNDLVFRTIYHASRFVYHYANPPINRDPRCRLSAKILRQVSGAKSIFRKLLGEMKYVYYCYSTR